MTLSLKRVSSIFIVVKDVKRSVKFYRDTLGFTEAHVEEAFAMLRLGDFDLMLHRSGTSDVEPLIHGKHPGGGVVFCIEAQDVKKWAERLKEAGYPPVRGPVDQPWGRTELTVDDPDGYRWDLWHRTVGRKVWPPEAKEGGEKKKG